MTQSQRQRREGGEERRCWNVQIRKNIKKVNAVWSCRGLFACSHAAAALMFKLMLWNIYLFSKTLDLWEWIGTKRGTVQRCNRNYFNEHLVLFSTNYSSTSGIVAHFPINDITISFDCTQMPVPCVFLRRFVSLARVFSPRIPLRCWEIFSCSNIEPISIFVSINKSSRYCGIRWINICFMFNSDSCSLNVLTLFFVA